MEQAIPTLDGKQLERLDRSQRVLTQRLHSATTSRIFYVLLGHYRHNALPRYGFCANREMLRTTACDH
jgi:hypothetical protein